MQVRDIGVGEVHLFFNDQMVEGKQKFNVCVMPSGFFVINTKPTWPPNIAMTKAEYPFLDYDSHLSCAHISFIESDRHLPENTHRGVISRQTAELILAQVQQSKTLAPNDIASVDHWLSNFINN